MDISVYFEEQGSGFPLVLLHGNGGSCREFDSQLSYFSQYFRVIAPDTRGQGKTPQGHKPCSLSQFAEDLHDFLTEQGIRRAHILGFSDGGNIALLFALRYPQMVQKLILNGANLDPFGMKTSLFLQLMREYRKACREQDEAAQTLLGLMLFQPPIAPKELEKLTMPTLVLAGTDDLIRRGHTERIAKHIPISYLRFVEGDHFIVQSNAEAYNAVVKEFLV